MTSRDFCYWLQGFIELQEAAVVPLGTVQSSNAYQSLDPKQYDCVKRHLALVFKHEIDPSAGNQAHQDVLNKLHNPDVFCAPEQKPPWQQGPRPDGSQVRC